jgi:hypothetical protein
MARDSKMMGLVLATVNRAIARLYQKKTKVELGLTEKMKSGAVTFIQRYGSSLNLNIHFHILVVEGVWKDSDAKELALSPAAKAKLQSLLPPTDCDIHDMLCQLRKRITRLLEKHGHKRPSIDGGEFSANEDPGFFGDTSIVDELQSASTKSRLATGPNRGSRVRKFGQLSNTPFKVEVKGPRCFALEGFSLHANTFCEANEGYKLQRLIEYVARPPFANERLSLKPSGDVMLKLKRAFSDGTTHIVFSPLEFIEKLAALVPKPRVHLIRYAGAFARHAKIRPHVVGKAGAGLSESAEAVPPNKDRMPSESSKSWARLLKNVFGIDVASCHLCGSKNVKIIAAILEKNAITKILSHMQLPSDTPHVAAARAPPQVQFEW